MNLLYLLIIILFVMMIAGGIGGWGYGWHAQPVFYPGMSIVGLILIVLVLVLVFGGI